MPAASTHAAKSKPAPAHADTIRAATRPELRPAGAIPLPLAVCVQRKPGLSTPGDPYEREADQVAERVLRMGDRDQRPQTRPQTRLTTGPDTPVLARACSACSAAGKCSKCEEEALPPLYRKAVPANRPPDAVDDSEMGQHVLTAARRGGEQLTPELRAFFEPRFGYDFGQVLIHTGADAAHAARSVQARAYTLGSDIVFGAGEYLPSTAQGKRLLAHELTHVVQQRAASPGPLAQRASALPAPGGELVQRQPAPDNEEPACADAPRHLGDIAPEVPCDTPTVNLLGMSGSPQLQVFDFCIDSDVLLGASSASVAQFAKRQAAHTSFVVHGFASPEGARDYNQRLSCHRALRIARELMNAGVRSDQIREVSGLGATGFFSFGDPGHTEANRVALVLAESGEVAPLADPDRPAVADADKQTIVDRARERLIAGDYQLAADAFIDFWTCGRTPTLRHAVDRLRILLPENQQDENLRSKANGVEEDPTLGINTVRVSNTALRADNPVACTMGRLVDMAFHHALKGETGLSPELSDVSERSLRHQAGLHLIALAGLGSCAGNLARPRVVRNEPAGIDAPLADDPLAALDPPACARTLQETRLLRPAKDAKNRPSPPSRLLDARFELHAGEGSLDTKVGPRSVSTTSQPVISAAATVALAGRPELLADYEIGFMQTVLDDLAIAEYVSGHFVVQRLPVPLRTVDPRESGAAPPPWMALSAVRQPDAAGNASVEGTWRLQTAFETALNRLLPAPKGDFLDTWQRRTSVAIWLLKRRIDAPADRFSVEVIDGRTYELTQHLDLAARRSRGDLLKGTLPQPDDPQPGGEAEKLRAEGGFEVFQTSATPADLRLAQFGGAIPEDIDLARQVSRMLEPRVLDGSEGLTSAEYTGIVRRILDTPEILDEKGQRAAPRLGFVFDNLTITIRFNKETGRIIPVSGLVAERTGAVFTTKTNASVSVDSPGVGQVALNHLALALGLRLEKRDFLGEGRAAVLRRTDIPANGALVIQLPRLQAERQLIQDEGVRRDMAEMWACSELTRESERFLFSKEFARTYWVDRTGALQRLPPTEFFTSTANGEALTTNIECGNLAGAALGTAHTHPEDSGDGPNPSAADLSLSKTERCGRQNFIISKDLVVMYASGRPGQPIGERRTLLPQGVTCSRSIPGDVDEQ